MMRVSRWIFLTPVHDTLACLVRLAERKNPQRRLVLALLAAVAVWFLYVPVHELLHVLGCVLPGGEVTTLELSPWYGAAVLARWFPFIVSGGEYAGRLSGFETHGSDLIYLSTTFMPYTLTIVLGVPLLRIAARRGSVFALAGGLVVGLASFYNIPNDYFELGTILSTAPVVAVRGAEASEAFLTLRSDDVFRLVSDLLGKPEEMGFSTVARRAAAFSIVAVSLVISVGLAFLTYAVGALWASVIVGPREPVSHPSASRADAEGD